VDNGDNLKRLFQMKLTIPKILAGGVALFTLMFVFALTRIETPETRQTAMMYEVKDAISFIADKVEVSEETKIWALKRGYKIASDENPAMESIVVKTERIIPDDTVIEWTEKNALDASADVPELKTKADDVCTRHHLRKVTSRDGQSWRCKR